MAPEQVSSPEKILAERIKSALASKYKDVIESQDPEGMVTFSDFDSPEKIAAFLEEQGIEIKDLKIEVKPGDIKGYDYQDGRHGGDSFVGASVKISLNGRMLVEDFFESPAHKFEY